MSENTLIIRQLGLQPYSKIFQQMQNFTQERDNVTNDEIWFVEHFPVYTQGTAGKIEHIIRENTIPVVQSDRGGQITYHGPGQQIMYFMINLRKKNIMVRSLVTFMEKIIINTLADYNINAVAKADAPGVYIDEAKIASLGLRIKNGCSFHGIALNIDMDLSPFNDINPCGYTHLKMTQLSELIDQSKINFSTIRQQLVTYFTHYVAYSQILDRNELL